MAYLVGRLEPLALSVLLVCTFGSERTAGLYKQYIYAYIYAQMTPNAVIQLSYWSHGTCVRQPTRIGVSEYHT